MAFYNRLDAIIAANVHPTWVPMKSGALCLKVPLNENHPVYKKLVLSMQGDFLKKINGIYSIQNPILYEQFLLKTAECSLEKTIPIYELYHSTSIKNMNSIIIDNFDWSYSHRVKFGNGVSFSSQTSYANLQSNIKNGVNRAMIVADVIVGKQQKGNRMMDIPTNSCDTTVNKEKTVFVKYCDHEFYPKYVIEYETYRIIIINGKRVIKRC